MEEKRDAEYLVLSAQKGTYYYNRSSSPAVEHLEKVLQQRYNAKYCTIFPSGMSAISSTLHVLLNKFIGQGSVNLIYSNELYSDTPRLFKFLQEIYQNFYLHPIDVTKSDAIVNLFEKEVKDKTNILFIESCSNPQGFILDPEIIPILKKSSKILTTVVDNTWLSNVIYNPLEHHADIVVTSLTKYYSGGHAICGAALGNNLAIQDGIEKWLRINGLHVSPHNAEIVLDNIKTMDMRIKSSSDLTCKIVNNFKHQKIIKIIHPLLPLHPSHKLTQKLFKNSLYPSVFTFTIKSSKNKVLKAMSTKTPHWIEHKTSFGAAKTRSDPWPKLEDENIICRIAIGHNDDYDRVILGLTEMIDLI